MELTFAARAAGNQWWLQAYLVRLMPCVLLGLAAAVAYWRREARSRRGPGPGTGTSVVALEQFQRAVLHDFINRLRNRYPGEPGRYVGRLAAGDMCRELRDFLQRRFPEHEASLRSAPDDHGLAEMLSEWDHRLALLDDFLAWADAATRDHADVVRWSHTLSALVDYLTRVQDAILACVADVTLDVGDVLEEVEGLYPEVSLTANPGLTIRLTQVDRARDDVKSVVTNLCDNALNAGARNVSIHAQRRGEDWIQVTVSDDGPGLPSGVAQDIFVTGVGSGSGTGLAHVRDVVTQLRGRIEVASSSSGRGACFIVSLPREGVV